MLSYTPPYVNILNIHSTCSNLSYLGVCVIENVQIILYSHIEKQFDFRKFVKESRIREQNKAKQTINCYDKTPFQLNLLDQNTSKAAEAGTIRCSLIQISKKKSKTAVKGGSGWCIQININKSTNKSFLTKGYQ